MPGGYTGRRRSSPASPEGCAWLYQRCAGDSMIGYDLMAQFLVRIDFERRRMWLRRNPEAKLTPLVVEGRDPAEVETITPD